MSNNRVQLRIFSVLLVFLFMTSAMAQAVWAADTLGEQDTRIRTGKTSFSLDPIYLFYDPQDAMMSMVAEGVDEVLSYYVENVEVIPAFAQSDLSLWLTNEPWVAIYALRSNLTHVQYRDYDVTWTEFYSEIGEHDSTHHIVGMGNTLSLDSVIQDDSLRIHHCESEQTDALILVVYDLWAVADLTAARGVSDGRYTQAGQYLRELALKIYSDNFNEILKRTIEPVDIVGQIDEVALEKRTRQMWDEHAPTIRDAAYELTENGSLVEIPIEALPADFEPAIKLSAPSMLQDDDFKIGDLPIFSALRGPIGKIINILLEVLAGTGDTDISIPEGTMDTIRQVFEVIEPIVGIVANYDSDSPMKSIIEALANEFPFIEEYKGYLEILLKLLFRLRGDTSEIIGAVTEAVVSLLPELFPGQISEFVVRILGVDSGLADVVADVIDRGKGAFDHIASFFTTNVMQAIFNKTLVAVFGLDQSAANQLLERFTAFTKSLIGYLSSWDFEKFVTNVGEELLAGTLNVLTGTQGEEARTRIMSLIKLALTSIDIIDKLDAASVVEAVTSLVTAILEPGEMTGTADEMTRGMMSIVKDYKEGSVTDYAAFRQEVTAVVEASVAGTVQDDTIAVIVDSIAVIAGFFNDGFNPTEIPTIFEVADSMLTEMDFDTPTKDTIMAALNGAVKPVLGIVAAMTESDPLKEMVSKTIGQFEDDYVSIPANIYQVLDYLDLEDTLSGISGAEGVLQTLAQISGGVVSIVAEGHGQTYQTVMHSILVAVAGVVGAMPAFDDVPIDAFLQLIECFFPDQFGFPRDERPRPSAVIASVIAQAAGNLGSGFDEEMLAQLLELLMSVKDIFTSGVRWLVGTLFNWLEGMLTPLLDDIETDIEGIFGESGEILGYHSVLGIGLGDFNLFDLTIDLGLIANFDIDPTPLFDWITSLIFDGRTTFSAGTIGDFFMVVFKCFAITPQFYAELGVQGFDTSKNPMFAFLLEALGIELTFSGSAHFILNLFTFRGGLFEWEDFMKVVEWGFTITIGISRTLTFLDFVTGGGAGALNAIGEYIGLDSITVTIFFSIGLEIVKRMATALAPEVSTLTLTITIGAAINIGLDLYILSLGIEGIITIILTFFQDLSSGAPLKITLQLLFTIRFYVSLLFIDLDFEFDIINKTWDISPNKGEDDYKNNGIGFDTDDDGLGDEYEAAIPGLDPNNPDTDGDGANDKLEVQTLYTDPTNPDTDLDGLTDGEEFDIGTNPHQPDSDFESLTDFEEVRIYLTDPLCQDTDGDALSDDYEVFTSWNITTVTPTVTSVVIGGVEYNDHTDPLNPDTDGDGLLDGDEGPMAAYYGLSSLYNDSLSDPFPIIFNDGYTHPLDADTDDDSYLQLTNGVVDQQALLFLKDMNDGIEVRGIPTILYDPYGFPYDKVLFTNPCNPDSDGDTGVDDRIPEAGIWLNSDGYELAQTPPTNPLNGDTDGDGLIDGIEGVLNPYSNHTNPNMADTDGDLLYDMQEILLGCDPRCADTDGDMITDSDEFYTFHTNPLVPDSDFDSLKDGEEVFLWHSNPLSDDSDGDRLRDGREVLWYGSDPMDEDGDNDGLTDFEEVIIYYTDPFSYDTDGDGLSDGQEVLLYDTDPLSWDTDLDSIEEPNEWSEMTWPMNDYDEVMIYGTNATAPDSDLDGLSDGIELYLGAGEIPWMDPLVLDPLDEDTDGDLLVDGDELMLVNQTDIIYPYLSISLVYRYETSPVLADTDGDNLTDYQEVVVFNTNATNIDTDYDTIDDWHEVWVYNTSAFKIDTDGDDLPDNEETLIPVYPYGSWPPTNWSIGMVDSDIRPASHVVAQSGLYPTSATDWDCDDDWLPDGAEILVYGSNPLDDDSDGDGILDTLEFDTDLDGLPDGLEFQIGTSLVVGTARTGGYLNPDSDEDGLLDGDEVYIYGTSPTSEDSDGDGVSDGFEVAVGTDPLSMSYAGILSPLNGSIVGTQLTLQVMNYTTMDSMWFRYRTGSTWIGNETLVYSSVTDKWTSNPLVFTPGSYILQAFGLDVNGTERSTEIQFTVSASAGPATTMVVLTPTTGGVSYTTTAVRVVNLTTFDSMGFRYRTTGDWSENYTLRYSESLRQWFNDTIVWQPGTYTMQVFGMTREGVEYVTEIDFVVSVPGEFPWAIIAALSVALGVMVTVFVFETYRIRRSGRRTIGRSGSGESTKTSAAPPPEPTERVAEDVATTPEKDETGASLPEPTSKKTGAKTTTRKTTKTTPRRVVRKEDD